MEEALPWNGHPRKQMFVEKSAWLHHCLPINSFHAPRGMTDSNLCLLCAGGEELESHIPSRLQGGEPVWYLIDFLASVLKLSK